MWIVVAVSGMIPPFVAFWSVKALATKSALRRAAGRGNREGVGINVRWRHA
jgi:hypothetical protein